MIAVLFLCGLKMFGPGSTPVRRLRMSFKRCSMIGRDRITNIASRPEERKNLDEVREKKLLEALVNFDGVLQENESLLFQGELGQLTAALLNARMAGRYAVEKWRSAISVNPVPASEALQPSLWPSRKLASKRFGSPLDCEAIDDYNKRYGRS